MSYIQKYEILVEENYVVLCGQKILRAKRENTDTWLAFWRGGHNSKYHDIIDYFDTACAIICGQEIIRPRHVTSTQWLNFFSNRLSMKQFYPVKICGAEEEENGIARRIKKELLAARQKQEEEYYAENEEEEED